MAIITGANAAEYNLMFGKGNSGWKNRLARVLASMGMEATEETSNLTTQEQEQSQQAEQSATKPIFDLNAEDDGSKSPLEMYNKFVEMFTNTVQGQQAAEVQNFFSTENGMLNRRGEFINNAENRARIREEYPTELTDFANSYFAKSEMPSTATTSPVETRQTTQTINNTQQQKMTPQTPKTPNLDSLKARTVENTMKRPKRFTRAFEISQEPISKNADRRRIQGRAAAYLADDIGVTLEPKLQNALLEGYEKAINKAREQLSSTGIFNMSLDEAFNKFVVDKVNREIAENQENKRRKIEGLNVFNNLMNSEDSEQFQAPSRQNEAKPQQQGKMATITTDSGKEYQAKYKVVDINDIVSSDNEKYPQELQPRDRNRKSLELQVEQMAQNLRPQDLMDSRNINQGAPVIRNDGVVVNGNGRTMAIRKAYDNNSADDYKQSLIDNAERLGLNANEISRIQRPILVRSLDNVVNENIADLTQSTTGGSRMGASEQAQIDADKISSEALSRYVQNDNGDFTTAANRDFVGSVLSKISNQNDLNAYTDKDGNVNADGINRVKRAVFAKAYGDENLVSKMAESTDDNVRNVSTGLMNAAPNMAQVQIGMDKGNLHKYNIAKNIKDAVQKLSALREEGTPVNEYLSKQSMFDEYQDTNEMKDILSFLDKNKRSGKRISAFFNKIADLVKAQGDPKQEQLFEAEPLTERAIIAAARESVENGGSQDLFAGAEKSESTAQNGKMGTVSTDGRGQEEDRVSGQKRQGEAVSVEENIANGKKAIEKVIRTHEDVHSAMHRDDVGDIDFLWGYEGDLKKKYKNGYGVSHIIARRNIQGLDGEAIAKLMPEVIARGKKQAGINDSRVEFHYDEYMAVLSKNQMEGVPEGNKWLVTGFKKIQKENTVSERGEGFDSAAPTTPTPTLRASQESNGAPVRSVTQSEEKGKEKSEKWTDEKIDKVVAGDESLANSVKTFNGKIKDGHVTFENLEDKKNFIKHLENLENPDFKMSVKGTDKATVENFVDPKDLTEQQRGIAEFGDQLGVPVVYFKGSEELNGAHANGITYINVNSKVNPRWIFWHESGHWLKAQHPELISDIIDNLGISREQVDDFRERTKRYDLTDNEAREEIFCDNMFDADKRLDLMQTLGKKDASLLDRLVSWLKSIMDRFTSYFNTPKYGLTNTQKNQMFAELGKALRQIKQNGKPRYRYGNTTHVVQYADGRELPKPSMRYSDKGAFNFGEMKEVREKYEGTKEWLKAPNGKKTNLTEKQWLMVRTKSFKRWFGDWENDPANASKVVDENGEPKVVYHGTPNGEFTVFDKKRLGETTDRTNLKMSILGFYFTNDDWVANDYAKYHGAKSNPHMFSVFLRTVNPLVVEDDGWGSAADQTDARRSDLARWAKEDNNDGIIVVSTDYELENDELDTVYVVSEPNQIKSATDNVGTFDKDDPDIRFSISSAEKKSPKSEVREKLMPLVGKPITNKATGIIATIGTRGINEMLSNSNVDKSIRNGYSQSQHLEAAANVKQLYEDASLTSIDPDRKKKKEGEGLKSVKRFHCKTNVAGEDAVAKLTIKESFQHGHKIYAIELEELNKPTELKNRAESDSSAGSKGSTLKGNVSGTRDAEEPSNQNISQNESEGKSNVKYSIGNSSSNSEDNSGIINAFRHPLDTLAKKYGLKGDKIIDNEDMKARKREQQNAAMDEYIKNPTKENRQKYKKLGVTESMLEARRNGEEFNDTLDWLEKLRNSPSKIAEKLIAFRGFYNMGDRAQKLLIRLRDNWNMKLNKAWDYCKSKDEVKDLSDLLIAGDIDQVDYGELTEAEKAAVREKKNNADKNDFDKARVEKIVREHGVTEGVANGYLKIRQLITAIGNKVDEALRKPRIRNQHLTDKEIEKLKGSKFLIEILKIGEAREDGKKLVSWKENSYREPKDPYLIDAKTLESFKKDDAIEIKSVRERADGMFEVRTREGHGLHRLKGYIPHLFHKYMVRIVDKDGKPVDKYGYGGVINSGRTHAEAVKLANEWKKNNQLAEGEEIYIAPKAFNFESLGINEKDYSVIMGDKDYERMIRQIADNNGMKLAEAERLLDGSVKLKNRHRFLGSTMKRKGAKGYSEDMQWVLRHWANQCARYYALETEFKPQAISLFERMYGDFDKDWSRNSLAKYTKDYIESINGTPSHDEAELNKALNSTWFFKNFITPRFGERSALTAVNSVTEKVAHWTLGVWNASSAVLNYTQLINAGAYINDYGRLAKWFKGTALKVAGLKKFTTGELKILTDTGVLQDIGMDTSTGYDKNRSNPATGLMKKLYHYTMGGGSMILFQKADMHCRVAATLAAYEKALAEGKSRQEAINFAKNVNRKANFSYGVEDAPEIFRKYNLFGKLGLQFMKYTFKELEVMGDMLSKKTSIGQKARFWIPYVFLAGLMGVPGLDEIDDLLKAFFKFSPKDFAQKNAIEYCPKIFGETLGKPIAKMIMYGGGAALNVDASKRVGMANLIPDDLFGATVSKAMGIYRGVRDDEYANALRSFSPGMYNIYTAFIAEHSEGKRGRTNTVYENLWDKMIRGAGFKSVDESLAVDIKRILSNEQNQYNKERQKVIDALVDDPYDKEAQKKARELGIKGDQVREERKKKQQTYRERTESGMSKRQKNEYKYLSDFAK